MNANIFRAVDMLQPYLLEPVMSSEEKKLEEEKASYPFPHPGESAFHFNLRMNAFKTEAQILAEISQNGVGDFYMLYQGTRCESDWSGLEIYESDVEEMRIALERSQVTKSVCLALLAAGALYEDLYPAYMPLDLEFDRDIWLAAISSNPKNVDILRNAFIYKGDSPALHPLGADPEIITAAIASSGEALDEVELLIGRFPEYIAAKEKASEAIRNGSCADLRARGYVLSRDLGI